MKTLQNNFTTPEQSKRLLELGVPRWTADEYRDIKGFRHSLEGILDIELYFQNFPECTPCWSVGRLIEIFEICTPYKISQSEFTGTYIVQICKAFLFAKEMKSLDFSKLEE